MEPLGIKALLSLTHELQLRGVPYLWGGKVSLEGTDPAKVLSHFRGIDCSGFAQLAAFMASDRKVRLPEGSAEQHEHLKPLLGPSLPYATVGRAASNTLYISFIAPVKGSHAGHVWFTFLGHTCESHGGGGVDRRPWNTPVLVREVVATYVWPHQA